MMFGTVGHPLLFPLTALVGTATVILIARLVPAWMGLQRLGEVTLIIYCLHGFFYHFANPPLAAWMQANLPTSSAWILGAGSALAVAISLAIAATLALLLERYLPVISGGRRRMAP
jgi:fucose 4-O-acetylase-like acetyltransferase